ncbi:hypothetical protein M432DRAFT_373822 [Thermoascus aurantiacus ATCC 26904]
MDTNDEVDESPCLNLLLSIIIITQGWSCFLCTVHYIYGGLFSLSSTAMVLETFTRRCLAVCHVILTIPFFLSFLARFFPLYLLVCPWSGLPPVSLHLSFTPIFQRISRKRSVNIFSSKEVQLIALDSILSELCSSKAPVQS